MASNMLTKSALAWTSIGRSSLRLSRLVLASRPQGLVEYLPAKRSLTTVPPTPPNDPLFEPKQPDKTIDQRQSTTDQKTSFNEGDFDEETVKKNILLKALNHVGKHGFTMDAIEYGSIDAGLSSSAKNMFENGEFDLIDFFYKKCNADVNEFMENQLNNGPKPLRSNELIRSALIHRLKLLQPYIEHWPNAMAVMSFQPQNAVKSFNNLLSLCDDIWHHAGDKSTDLNWYSKRLILASLYKSTELYMIQDKSPEFQDTIKFLDNRFQDLSAFYKLNNEISNLADGVKGSFTVLKNILNLK